MLECTYHIDVIFNSYLLWRNTILLLKMHLHNNHFVVVNRKHLVCFTPFAPAGFLSTLLLGCGFISMHFIQFEQPIVPTLWSSHCCAQLQPRNFACCWFYNPCANGLSSHWGCRYSVYSIRGKFCMSCFFCGNYWQFQLVVLSCLRCVNTCVCVEGTPRQGEWSV